MKTYLVIVAVLLAVGFRVYQLNKPTESVTEPVAAVEAEEVPEQPKISVDDISIYELWKLTNNHRVEKGRDELSLNPKLMASAWEKCQDMAIRNYWSHNTPEGITPFTFIDKHYYYRSAGENLAHGYNDAYSTVNGWKISEEHNKNLLDNRFTDVGFAVCFSDETNSKKNQLITVQHFAN